MGWIYAGGATSPLPPASLRASCFAHTHIWRQRFLAGLSAMAPNSQLTLWRQSTAVKAGRGAKAVWDAAVETHLVLQVRGVDQRRSDGGLVRQRLAQEGVVSFTWATQTQTGGQRRPTRGSGGAYAPSLTLSAVAEGCRELRAVRQDGDGRDARREALDDAGRLARQGGERQ